jgi:hypothetical protein
MQNRDGPIELPLRRFAARDGEIDLPECQFGERLLRLALR